MSQSAKACCKIVRSTRPSLLANWLPRPAYRTLRPSIAASNSYATQASIPSPAKSQQVSPDAAKGGSGAQTDKISPKIDEIVKSISQLTLLEAAELVDALKSRLNITELAMPALSAPATGNQASGASDADAKKEKAEPEKPKEKTAFNLTLTQIDATQKAKVIKEVKTIMPNMNLVEAKKFVESLPKLLKENGTKEEVEKLKKALESVGATVQVE